MSKSLELIETWEETLDFGSDRKMWAHVDLMVDELRRLAEIERKYNEIMAQEPAGEVYLYTGEKTGMFACAPFHQFKWKDGVMPDAGTKLYTLKKD